MLADQQIKDLLAQLPCNPDQTIMIISPDHFQQVRGNNLYLTDQLGADLLGHEKQALVNQQKVTAEHGYSALKPLIKHFCPEAQIIPLIVSNSNKNAVQLDRLGRDLRKKDLALLISSDFSHGATSSTTLSNDKQSLSALENEDWSSVINDCPNCWIVLDSYLGDKRNQFFLLKNSNSQLLGGGPDNITSYFSGWFY